MNRNLYAVPLVCAAALSLALSASADPIAGTTTGVFVHPVPAGATVTGVGTSAFTWGAGGTFGTGPNRMNFTAVPFSTDTETDFKLGSLSYFNGTTASGSTPETVDLSIGLNFATPPVGLQTSAFTLNLVSTPNTSDPDASADYVNFPSSYPGNTFVIGGTTYNLRVLGFRNIVGDGFLASDSAALHVREMGTATADLYGRVTTQTGVPEPGSLALLTGLAVSGATLLRRRKK